VKRRMKGFMLAEVLVATAILATAVGAYMAFYSTMKHNLKVSDYDYVAINLCREVMEWRESTHALHQFAIKYYYPPATGFTLTMQPGAGSGTSSAIGYGWKEWILYGADDGSNMPIEMNLLTKNLVPPGAPQSVIIAFYNYTNGPGGCHNAYASVEWRDTPDGPLRKRELGTLPMSEVNDQLQLREASFTWEDK